jgi:DNA-directed RNA polymerase specialized sigma24 family protein
VAPPESARQDQGLTTVNFGRLLEWLDDGVDSRGESYLEMRQRLVWYFDRRDRPNPEELADETLNRIARTLEESGTIALRPPARYCYVVARFVLLEDLRRREHSHLRLDEPKTSAIASARLDVNFREAGEGAALRERRMDCLDRCLEQLKPEQRTLILEYYQDNGRDKIERRRDMAKRLGLTTNALAVRACRIRDTLEACVAGCCKAR